MNDKYRLQLRTVWQEQLKKGSKKNFAAFFTAFNCQIFYGTGWMLRFAGTKDKNKLLALLDKYAAMMPRTLLRYSIEHFSVKEKEHYMNKKKK